MPSVLSKLSEDAVRLLLDDLRTAKADKHMAVPQIILGKAALSICVDDTEVLTREIRVKWPDTPHDIIRKLVPKCEALREIMLAHPGGTSVWVQKPIDMHTSGHSTQYMEILSMRCQYHELHFFSVSYESSVVLNLRGGAESSRIISLDSRLSDDDLMKSAMRIGRVAPCPCAFCGSLSPTKMCACQKARYCSVICQQQHWRDHKKVCAMRRVATETDYVWAGRCGTKVSVSTEIDMIRERVEGDSIIHLHDPALARAMNSINYS